MDFAVPVDQRVKIKECDKRDKYFNLARDLRKLGNIRGTMILIVIEMFRMIPNVLERGRIELEIRGRIESIKSKAFFTSG